MITLRMSLLVLGIADGEAGVLFGALELALEPPGEAVLGEELAMLHALTDAELEEASLALRGGFEVVPGHWRVLFKEEQEDAARDRLPLAMAAQEDISTCIVGEGECGEVSGKTAVCECCR